MPLTGSQAAVVDSLARGLTVLVKAGPGTGKTRTFCSAIARAAGELGCDTHKAVAALSFTNAAADEYADRIGSGVSSRHFVGTLDSFLLRFVVLPFGRALVKSERTLRLLPDPLDKHFDAGTVQISQNAGDRVALNSCILTGGTLEAPGVRVPKPGGGFREVAPGYAFDVFKEKKRFWKRSGLMTHSDSQYLAARILADSIMGVTVADVVRGRFPYILLDESQDTTYFEAKALAILMDSDGVAGLIVGDLDQGIYEFAGSQPEVFYAEILATGRAVEKALETTHRCPVSVCAVANALSFAGAAVDPIDGASAGVCQMLVYGEGSSAKLREEIDALVDRSSSIAVVARSHSALSIVQAAPSETASTGSLVADRLFQAVGILAAGEGRKAVQVASTALAKCLLDTGYVTDAVLKSKGVDPQAWKTLVRRSLLKLHGVAVAGCTHAKWVDAAKVECVGVGESLALPTAVVGPKLRKNRAVADKPLPTVGARDITRIAEAAKVGTVHSVKGQEYGTVVFLAPDSPSLGTDWFAERGVHGEEVRIAFVAATRVKETLVFCVSARAYDSLRTSCPEFVELFEVKVVQPVEPD